jgi:DNA polymerase III alpha subunit (gram-positive type)
MASMTTEGATMMTELFVSTDVETDGPIPGPNSMLSFASAVFTASGEMIDQFEANLFLLPGACGNEETMKWWATQPDAWMAHRQSLQDPAVAMKNYVAWLKGLPGKPVFVGYPAGFDFLFVYWYLIRFAGESPFSFSALDIKTYAMAVLGTDFRSTTKKTMPKEWFSKRPHTHRAIDDAIEQGELFCNILKARHERKE